MAEPYVVCEQFCGARIANPGKKDHHESCGAPTEEILRLNDMLRAAKIRAAADGEQTAAPSVADENAFVCSCGAGFEVWTELGAHQMETGHQGTIEDRIQAEAQAQAETSDEMPPGANATVDGKPARVTSNPHPDEPQDFSHLWRDTETSHAWLIEAQRKHDHAVITLGGITAGKACRGKMSVTVGDGSTVEIGCPHKIVVRLVKSNTCDLQHSHQETIAGLCAIHFISSLGGGIPVAGKGPLFGEDVT